MIPSLGAKAFQQLIQTQKQFKNVLGQLSSGTKNLNPASQQIANHLQASIAEQQQNQSNFQFQSNMLQTASSGIQQIQSELQGLRELALEASNETLSQSEREALQQEFDQKLESINSLAEQTQFGSQSLLDGSFEVGDFSLPSLTAESLGVDELDLSSSDSAGEALDKIDQALEQTGSEMAKVGAHMNQLEHAQNHAQSQEVQLSQGLSQLQDVNMPEGVAKLLLLETQLKAQIQSINTSNQLQKEMVNSLIGTGTKS